MAAPLKISTIFSAMDKFSAPLRAMANSSSSFADRIEATTARAERGFRRLSGGLISETGKQFLQFASTAAVAAGIVSGVMFSGQSIKDYEVAMASLEAVTGVASESFKKDIFEVANAARISSIEVAKSFEVVGSAMSQYLSDPTALRQITEAGVTLSKAAKMDLEPSLVALTSVMNQFGLSADMASDTINRLTAGEIVGSVSTAKISEYLQEFGASAKNANIGVGESVALIEALGIQMAHGKIATGARNILSVMDSAAGLPSTALAALKKHGVNTNLLMDNTKSLGDRLTELSKIQHDAVAMTDVFGKENKTAGTVIFAQLDKYKQFHEQIELTNEAEKQAAANSNTLTVKMAQMSAQWVNLITSSDQVSGGLNIVKNVIGFVTDNMATLATIAVTLTGAILAYKAVILTSTIVTGAYNIAIGVYNALFTESLVLTNQNAIAQKAFAITSKIGVAAFWLYDAAMVAFNMVTALATGNMAAFNAIMSANPIGLIIGAVVILIALIAAIVIKWDEWGAALSIFLGPLGLVISMIQSFRRNWDLIRDAFAKGDIGDAFKLIGFTILDAVIQPIQQLLELIGKLPGSLGEAARAGAQSMEKFRSGLGVSTKTNDDLRAGAARAIEMYQNSPSIDDQLAKAAINPSQEREDNMISRMETTQKQNVSIMVEDKTGRANVSSDNDIIPISLKSSFQF